MPQFPFGHRSPLPVEREGTNPWNGGFWNASWVQIPDAPRPPFVSAYRLRFTLDRAVERLPIRVAADERYLLYLDSEFVGRGNAQGDLDRWYFETYDLALSAGQHELFAYVWSYGNDGPNLAAHAQSTLRPGFLLAGDLLSEVVDTGTAPWQGAILEGIDFIPSFPAWGIGPRLEITGEPTGPGGMDRGAVWRTVEVQAQARSRWGANEIFPTRLLDPSTIPPQRETPLTNVEVVHVSAVETPETSDVPFRSADHRSDEADVFRTVLEGTGAFLVPAGERRRILLRFPDYACVYPALRSSGGAGSTVRVHVQESLIADKTTREKGNRDEIEGKFFTTLGYDRPGIGDTFHPRGFRQDFQSFEWISGLYAEVFVDGGERGTAIFSLRFTETRYPLDLEGWPKTDDPELAPILKICRRGLEMTAHESFVDCGYERLQYVWDARLQGLCALVFGCDDRLVRKALESFADSLSPDGMIASRYPSRVRQVIPTFGLLFVGMLHDYARWRGDSDMISAYLPTARAILAHYQHWDLRPPGWNFVDWVREWAYGVPPGSAEGVDPIIVLLATIAKRQLAELEAWVAGTEVRADAVHPWPGDLLASLPRSGSETSEHFAALSVLLGKRETEDALASDSIAPRATFAFAHLVFEAYDELGRADLLLARIKADWGQMVRDRLRTTIEMPEPTRSDCHGWGAHPAYHLVTGLFGLKPVGLGGRRFSLQPNLPAGITLEASASTAEGPIHLQTDEGKIVIEIPSSVTVVTEGGELGAGRHTIESHA